MQEVLCRDESLGPEPHRFEQTLEGFADRFIIVHNRDEWLWAALPFSFFRLLLARTFLHKERSSTVRGQESIIRWYR